MSGSLLTDYLRNVSFNDSFTNIKLKFDSNQDGPVWYDIVKYEANTGCWNNIGEYTAANKLSKNKLFNFNEHHLLVGF